ncbi:nucleophosmin 1a isoform X2 [Poeciliopsis prolifica]|uniref:nucleophosmin 1a isoform X2 n=1 Tax=Poeciliopsis prolifica TaxID=188132 RepID=UPI002413066A|nr:nucleophosmin 1a isoform X2 [Poeciliopsis prolifica]
MKGLNNEPMAPQTFLYGCILEAGKEVVFHPDDDELEHQLDLRMACVDPSSKDELHLVEVEGQDSEGQMVKAALVSLKPSTLPSVCLGGFTVTPPTVFRLKTGSGPVHLSGQHLIMMENDQSFDEDDDEDEEEEEDEAFPVSRKRSMQLPVAKSQKKQKMEAGDDEDDEEDDEDDEEDDEEDEESETEESPVKAKQTQPKATVAKQKGPAQNGKNSAQSTPAPKQGPKGKAEKSPKTQATPKVNLTLPQLKTKLMEAMKKGITLPKVQPKFENFVKHSNKVSDPQIIADLWKWRQTLKDEK